MESTGGSWWKISIWVIVVAITLWFLFAVRTILLPFALAFIISVLLEPVIQKLRRRGMSRPISVLLVIAVFFVTVGVGFVTAVPRITNQLTAFTAGLEEITQQLSDANESQSVFTRWNPVVKAKPSNATQIDHFLAANEDRLKFFGLPSTREAIVRDYVEPHRDRAGAIVRGFFSSFVGLIGSAASAFLLLLFTPVFVALMLLDMDSMRRRTASWIPPSIRAETVSLMHDVGQVFLN
ncbi:MAG: AI-2E family transporter, partial [Armatimonadetes bacterium]|nr:AI-2E family transporter [Armatimonadota bacterium]